MLQRLPPILYPMRWICPACSRTFGRTRQGHVCVPAISLEDYFAGRPEFERPIVEAVLEHLRSLGPVEIEPVGIGILIKKKRTVMSLRQGKGRVALGMMFPRRLDDPRIRRTWSGNGRFHYGIDLRSPADIDDQVRAWLTESYLAAEE